MDMLDALYCRKKVEKYSQDALSSITLGLIRGYFSKVAKNCNGLKLDMEIVENLQEKIFRNGLFSKSAPYYMVIYAEKAVRDHIYVGFVMQKMALFLCTLGLGSCYLPECKVPEKLREKNSMKAYVIMEFGRSQGSYMHRKREANRMSVVQLGIYQETPREWINRLLDAARFAPSYKNEQPWRFLIKKSEFHIYTKFRKAENMKKSHEIDFGALLANIYTAAEELWLQLEFLKQDNVSCKNFFEDQYFVSVILKNKEEIY